jgi:ABC-type dipeptide/oligopeptide/nickel transport system permease component
VPADDAGAGARDRAGGLHPDRGREGPAVRPDHVGRPTFGATVSFAPVTLPLFLTNIMLVEMVFSVPGFFYYVWGAIGHNSENAINLPIIIAAALWMTVLLIVLSLIADAILGRIDPRVRDAF